MLKPFIPQKLPLKKIAWVSLLPNIIKANSALAKFDGLLENIQNLLLFLSPLMTQEAVLSSRIEGTQASLDDILEYEVSPKRKLLITEMLCNMLKKNYKAGQYA